MYPTPASTEERRKHIAVRDIFESAYELVEPFLDPANGWSGKTLEFLAFRAMREKYPGIDGTEIRVFLSAARRIFDERHPPPNR